MFVSSADPNHKGNVAEAAIAFHAMRLGIPVCRPLIEHCRYDLVLELGGELRRVQCKWVPRRGEVIPVRFVGNRRGPNGFIRTRYTAEEIDAIAAYCEQVDKCYYLPIEEIGDRDSVQLRLTPPKNCQRASVTFAANHELGAVAQLEVAPRWQRGGRGFESHRLHSSNGVSAIETVGAHEFRNLFGWYAERAAAGERFLVTRRGKPYVRLIPAIDPLPGGEVAATQPSRPSRSGQPT